MKHPIWLALLVLVMAIGGTQAPIRRPFDPQQLSGNITLRLHKGVWKLSQEKPTYQDMILDLTCDRGQCQPQVWGFAPQFNRDVDHFGYATVKALIADRRWQIQIDLQIQRHPEDSRLQKATYTIALIPHQSQLLGSYRGKVNGRILAGNVTGTLAPTYPSPVSHHRPLVAEEHPRLIFRADRLSELRAKGQTPAGQAILAQLRTTLAQPVYYDGFVPTGGYHAAGHCFLSLLESDQKSAERGWELVAQSIAKPGDRLLEQSAVVAGVALAYDLCYGQWSGEQRKNVTSWLANQSDRLLKGDSPKRGWNNYPGSNWNARARGAAGLAALAIWQEPAADWPSNYQPERAIALAHRNLWRYQQTALGDRGFGIEGDHYTTEPIMLTVLPFFQAYSLIIGKNLYANSPIEGLIPLYLMRMVPDQGKLAISPYGRHRHYPGGSLLTMGLGLLGDHDYPAVKQVFDRYLGLGGDRSFGIELPHQAIYALVGYESDRASHNPLKIYDRVEKDSKNGFYLFRNQWQGEQDIVTSFYVKTTKARGGWSFPEVGSLRLWGLGQEWAIAAPSEGEWTAENVVVFPQTKPWSHAQPLAFQSRPNGSGIISLRTFPSADAPDFTATRFLGVDYSGQSGAPGLWVLADHAQGKRTFTGDRHWLFHTQGEVTIKGQAFTVRSPQGATLQGTFIAPQSVKIRVQTYPWGKRITALGDGNFYVVLTLQQGKAPAVKIQGQGMEAVVDVGKQQIYLSDRQVVFSKF